MKKQFSVALLLFIGIYSYSQEKKLPAGWDIVSLDNKPAYMNLITGSVSKTYPTKAAVKPVVEKEFDPTIIHKVKRGETLSTIARKYGFGLAKLYRLNSVANFDNLKIGQEIVIGYVKNQAEKTAFSKKNKKSLNSESAKRFGLIIEKEDVVENKKVIEKEKVVEDKKKPANNYHIVVANETLYGISVNYKISVDSLKALNKLKNNTVFIGQKLRVKK